MAGPSEFPGVYNGKNRSFFFFNINWIRVATFPASSFISVPTPAFKNGDFSELKDAQGNLIPIYDPATTRPDGKGGFTRDPFPGNIIPEDRFSTVAKNVLPFYPNPTGPGIYNNFLERQVNNPKKNNFTIKIDHRIKSSQTFTLTLNRDNYDQSTCANPCFDPQGKGTPSAQQWQDNIFQHRFARLSYDWVATPAVLLHATLGANRQWQTTLFNSWGKGFPAKLGITNVLAEGAFPYIYIPPFTQVGANGNGVGGGTSFQLAESLSWVRGRHTLKFGGQHGRYFAGGEGPGTSGVFNFSQSETALPSALSTTGSSFASLLLGRVDNAFMDIGMPGNAYRWSYHAAYIQDDLKLRRNLTVNLGLRWDLWQSIYGVYDNYTVMDPTVPNPGAGGRPGALIYAGSGPGRSGRRKLTPPDVKHNFGPRLGIAWQISPRTVIRTAYGINYFAPAPAGSSSFRGSALGFGAHPVFTTEDQGITPAFNWDNGFPAFQRPPFISPTFANGSDVGIWDSNATHPAYVQNWHFTVQHELAAGWLLDTGYVASKGTRLLSGLLNPNQVNPVYLKYGALLNDSIYDPAVVAAGFKPPYAGFTGSLAQSLRPFPQYNVVGAGDQPYAIWTAARSETRRTTRSR